MMATVPHITSGSGLRKFQADGFLLDKVYLFSPCMTCALTSVPSTAHWTVFKAKFCCTIFLTVSSQNSNYPVQNINSQIKLCRTSYVGSMYSHNTQTTAYEVSRKLC